MTAACLDYLETEVSVCSGVLRLIQVHVLTNTTTRTLSSPRCELAADVPKAVQVWSRGIIIEIIEVPCFNWRKPAGIGYVRLFEE